MEIKHNYHPIKQSYYNWINNHPFSHHPLDNRRFYVFVKCVFRYGRGVNYVEWLRKRLIGTCQNSDIDYYSNLMMILIDFHKTHHIQIYEI